MLTKECGIVLTKSDLDEPKGIVSASVSVLNNIDDDRDMIMNGAFKKTLKENGPRIKHFLNHQIHGNPVGIPREIKERQDDLFAVSQYLLKTDTGRNTFEYVAASMTAGVPVEHSIGFNIVKSSPAEDGDEREYTKIHEIRLWEFSTLTNWGANSKTGVHNVKSDTITTPRDLRHQIKTLSMILKRDNLPHNELKQIESQVDDLYKIIKSLIEPTSANVTHKPSLDELITSTKSISISDLLNS